MSLYHALKSALPFAKNIIDSFPRYRIKAQCDICRYAEECVVDYGGAFIGGPKFEPYADSSKSNEENLFHFYDDFYKGQGHNMNGKAHPHPVRIMVEQISKDTSQHPLRQIPYPAF